MVVIQNEKYRSMEQDRKPEINPCTYNQLIYDKGAKKKKKGKKDSLFKK